MYSIISLLESIFMIWALIQYRGEAEEVSGNTVVCSFELNNTFLRALPGRKVLPRAEPGQF